MKQEVCIWSNGECFGQVDVLDTLFQCKGLLNQYQLIFMIEF